MPNTDERYTNLAESLLTGLLSDEEIEELRKQVAIYVDIGDESSYSLLESIANALNNGEQVVSPETGRPMIVSRTTKLPLTISQKVSDLLTMLADQYIFRLDEALSTTPLSDHSDLFLHFCTILEAIPAIWKNEHIQELMKQMIVQAQYGANFLDNITGCIFKNPILNSNFIACFSSFLTSIPEQEKLSDIFNKFVSLDLWNYCRFCMLFCHYPNNSFLSDKLAFPESAIMAIDELEIKAIQASHREEARLKKQGKVVEFESPEEQQIRHREIHLQEQMNQELLGLGCKKEDLPETSKPMLGTFLQRAHNALMTVLAEVPSDDRPGNVSSAEDLPRGVSLAEMLLESQAAVKRAAHASEKAAPNPVDDDSDYDDMPPLESEGSENQQSSPEEEEEKAASLDGTRSPSPSVEDVVFSDKGTPSLEDQQPSLEEEAASLNGTRSPSPSVEDAVVSDEDTPSLDGTRSPSPSVVAEETEDKKEVPDVTDINDKDGSEKSCCIVM